MKMFYNMEQQVWIFYLAEYYVVVVEDYTNKLYIK
jgi:hypothetical protein